MFGRSLALACLSSLAFAQDEPILEVTNSYTPIPEATEGPGKGYVMTVDAKVTQLFESTPPELTWTLDI